MFGKLYQALFHPPTSFVHLSDQLYNYSRTNSTPKASFWPKQFYLPKQVTDNIRKMRDWTKEDGFEYELSVMDALGDVVVSPLIKGERHQVFSSHSTKVRYNRISDTKIEKIVEVDGKVQLRKKMEISAYDSERRINRLISFHTHPAHSIDQEARYGYFSVTDMNTFITQETPMMGLITDRVWIACKTDKTTQGIRSNGETMLQRISDASYAGHDKLEDLVRTEMKGWGIVFYLGKVNDYFQRIN